MTAIRSDLARRALIGFACAILYCPTPASTATGTRHDPIDEFWLIGNLAWNQGQGTIVWSSEPASEDPGGQASGAPTNVPPPDVFVSDPLPTGLLLNASRLIQLELLIKLKTGQSESSLCNTINLDLEVQLLAGDRFFAGAVDGHGFAFAYHRPGTAPTGYARCLYRMPTEVPKLSEGERLTLKLVYLKAMEPYKYGHAFEHASQLRLPFYGATDAFFRDPEREKEFRSPPRSQGFVDSILPAGVGAMALAVAPSGARRRAAVLALALLVVAPGCLGPAGSAPKDADPESQGTDDLSSVHVEPDGGLGVATHGSGGIIGRVHDLGFVPIPSAHVTLLGTPNFTATDGQGQFSLRGIRPGEYTLRVDKEGFQSAEVRAPVVANNLTRVEILMLTIGQYSNDTRPHRHDYWGPDVQRTALKDTLPYALFYIPPNDSADHNTVLPGTYEVTVVLGWEPTAVGFDRLGLNVAPNHDLNPANWTIFPPRPVGEPFRIVTNWEMADSGHQLFSTWYFQPFGMPEDAVQRPTLPPPATVDVEVTLTKGLVPLEPPHPDHWGDRQTLLADQGKFGDQIYDAQVIPELFFATQGMGCREQHEGFYLSVYWGLPFRTIPQGTRWLELRMNMSESTDDATTGGYGWHVWYKSGERPYQNWLNNAGRIPSLYRQGPTGTTSNDGLTVSWRLPILDTEADGIYNKKTAWSFAVLPDDHEAGCNDSSFRYWSPAHGEIKFTDWTVIAHRDPLPES